MANAMLLPTLKHLQQYFPKYVCSAKYGCLIITVVISMLLFL